MQCPNCGRDIPDDSVLCAYCGRKLGEIGMMECPHCGKEIPEDAALCSYCGKSVAEPAQQVVQQPAQKAEEKTYLSDRTVTITSTRVVIGTKTYAMSLISSVQVAAIEPNRMWPIIFLLAGIVVAVAGFAGGGSDTNITCGVVGIVVALVSGVVLFSAKTQYAVRISSASGEADALKSPNREYITKIVRVLTEAITDRG